MLKGEAVLIHTFETMQVAGLLQMSEYAYALLKRGRAEGEVEDLVATRITRQAILTAEGPCHVVVIHDESAIRRPIGGSDVMRGQLKHLIALSSWPNVNLHIVPSVVGAYAGLRGALTTLGFPDGRNLAYVEDHVGG